jgi:hypothetical protein
VVIVAGYWSSNIGNSFFQLGAEYLLRQVFPNDRVVMLSDQPGYWNVRRGNPLNALILLEHVPLDYLVILGPFLRPEYDRIWLQTLRTMYNRGVKIILLSAGAMDYSQSAIRLCRTWLSETPPYILVTRDEYTYNSFADLAEYAYNGIDVAFFVSDLFRPIPVDLDEFVIFNFDKIPEPKVWRTGDRNDNAKPDYVFEVQGDVWKIKFPGFRTAMSRKFKRYPFVDALWPQAYPERIGEMLIVRTDHRFNPLFLRKAFRAPNSFVSDFPYTYLTLYANAIVTLSNRVHACVATLAYGKRAMLFSNTPRAKLLERVGLKRITLQPQRLNLDCLAEEKSRMINFLSSVVDRVND